MSQLTATHIKKRKQASKGEQATKRHKKDRKTKETDFEVVNASLVVAIPPIFARDPRAGVEEMLDSMVMRYIPALRGVVLSHSNLNFLDNTATIQADCPFLVCKVMFDATVWIPHVGMKLVGKVNLCSPDHVSLLVHRTFNASIPRHHIPTEGWEFEYGPAENDPEFGLDAQASEDPSAEEGTEQTGDGGGKWVHKLTSEKLGGTEGYLEFTVTGLTVANEMLSLLGSIQPDPFSPAHVPQAGPPSKPLDEESDQDEFPVEETAFGGHEEDDIDSDEDTFGMLGRKADEAAAKEAIRRAELASKDKKRNKNKEGAKKQKRSKS